LVLKKTAPPFLVWDLGNFLCQTILFYQFSSNLPAPINEGPDPQTKEGNLIIEGNLTTGDFKMTTGADANKVLTSNASGVASWQTAAAGGTPAGSTGYVQFASSTSFAGDSNLFWDNTNKRLGIGTSIPSGKLEVVGNIKISGIQFPDGSVQTTAYRDTRKRIFITSTTYNGNLGGLAGADAKCQARAVAGILAGYDVIGTYIAWLSSSATSVSARSTHSTLGYIRIDGTLIANNWEDLTDGTLIASPNMTELGGTWASGYAPWTGTSAYGLATPYTCNAWTNATATYTGTLGWAVSTSSTWTDYTNMQCGYTSSPLICIQQ